MAFRTNKTPVLQTKSASGSVASFNTALTMPLSSCNIALTATQSGSGTPSPDNVRPINGYSEVNATRAGKNLIDISKNIIGKYINSSGGETTTPTAQNWAISDYIPVAKGGVYTFNPNTTEGKSAKGAFYDENKQYLPNSLFNSGAITITVPSNAFYVRFSMRTTSYDVQLEVGSTATDYEPYNGTTATITIGSTVYGGEYDARTGVFVANVKSRVFNGAGSEDWGDYPSGNGYSFSSIADMQSIVLYDGLCNWLKVRTTIDNTDTNAIYIGVGNKNIYAVGVKDIAPTLADWRTYLSNFNLIITYPLATPTTIQLPPCPIDTIANSVNNIWADTGDVDLTYKDLDIAKRGNFREVFRLPS